MTAPGPRDGVSTDISRAFAYATFILSVPRVATEALVVFPGLGEDERVSYAVRRWTQDDFDHFFVAGLLGSERTARELSVEALRGAPFYMSDDMTDHVYTQVDAANTKVQSEWVAAWIKTLQIRSVTLTTSTFHLPRAYGTLLRALWRIVPWQVALIPDPTPMSPVARSPETGMTLSEMIHGEYPRIPRYQASGDVATLKELEWYLDWLYRSNL